VKRRKLTCERARELFRYDRRSGKLYWRVKVGKFHAGDEAGCTREQRSGNKYRIVGADGSYYLVHSVVWLMAYGYWPKAEVDHENGDGLDNRLKNLRDVTRKVNCQNTCRRRDNTSGQTGVYRHESGSWCASISVNKRRHLGSFSSFDEAVRVRKRAEVKYGFHVNHGRSGRPGSLRVATNVRGIL
jgi:hypothetical protein